MTILSTTATRGVALATLMLSAAPALAAAYGSGTVALGTVPYKQDFDGLASSGSVGTALPAGWRVVETGDNANASYGVGTGSSNMGDVYSFGAANSTERALGTLRSGSLVPTIGAVFSNATGSSISSLLIAFTGEQWRNGSASIDSLNFQYSLTSTNIGDAVASSAWTSVTALDFVSPFNAVVGSVNGNASANSRTLSAAIASLSIASGASFAFRWIDANPSGADDGLAIDNFSLGATNPVVAAVPEPTTWVMMLAGFGLIGFALRRKVAGSVQGAVAV